MANDMPNFKYPNITAGYIGLANKNASLNSAFYYEIIQQPELLQQAIIFPQRVLKNDFFKEIYSLENQHVKESFSSIQTSFFNNLNNALTNLANNKILFLNTLNLLLRYGLLNEIIQLNLNEKINLLNESEKLEFLLIKEIAAHRNNKPSNIKKLANIILAKNNLTDRIKIITLNYIIVACYRFGATLDYKKYINACQTHLVGLVESSLADFGSVLRKSIAYRGLAMITEIDSDLKYQYLKQAENIARTIQPTSSLENILAKENLYTCLQTLSKWHIQASQLDLAEQNLKEMLTLDPNDSTGYGEMGFLLLDQERFSEAAKFFCKAAELGPPGVGLHKYYYAKCLQAINQAEKAAEILLETTEIDKEAVSPWLDLLDHHLNINNMSAVHKIVNLLLKTPIYKEQLDDDELNMLSDLCNA